MQARVGLLPGPDRSPGARPAARAVPPSRALPSAARQSSGRASSRGRSRTSSASRDSTASAATSRRELFLPFQVGSALTGSVSGQLHGTMYALGDNRQVASRGADRRAPTKTFRRWTTPRPPVPRPHAPARSRRGAGAARHGVRPRLHLRALRAREAAPFDRAGRALPLRAARRTSSSSTSTSAAIPRVWCGAPVQGIPLLVQRTAAAEPGAQRVQPRAICSTSWTPSIGATSCRTASRRACSAGPSIRRTTRRRRSRPARRTAGMTAPSATPAVLVARADPLRHPTRLRPVPRHQHEQPPRQHRPRAARGADRLHLPLVRRLGERQRRQPRRAERRADPERARLGSAAAQHLPAGVLAVALLPLRGQEREPARRRATICSFQQIGTQNVGGGALSAPGQLRGLLVRGALRLQHHEPDGQRQARRTLGPHFTLRDYLLRFISPCNCWAAEFGVSDTFDPNERLYRFSDHAPRAGVVRSGSARGATTGAPSLPQPGGVAPRRPSASPARATSERRPDAGTPAARWATMEPCGSS